MFWGAAVPFLLACFIGLVVGVVATLLHTAVDSLSHFRIEIYERSAGGEKGGYLPYAALVAFLGAAGMVITWLAPGAAGAGVPAVLSYLNGAKLPGVMNRRTLFGKVLGTIFTVATGISSGPEAPIIHIGAVVGAQSFKLVKTIRESLVRKGVWLYSPQSHDADERDAIGFGAGAGIATAFSAPVGGLFFFIEEACSYFSLEGMWKAFLCCVTGYWIQALWTAVRRSFAVMSVRSSNPLCNLRAMNISDLLGFSVIGIMGGLLGALFNSVVHRLHLLASTWSARTKLLYTATFISFSCLLHIFLPLLFDCVPLDSSLFLDSPTFCFPPQYDRQLFRSSELIAGGINTTHFSTRDSCLAFSSNETIRSLRSLSDRADPPPKDVWGGWNGQPGTEALGHALPVPLPGLYTKAVPIVVSWAVEGNCPAGMFNPMASLLVNPLDRAVKLLFIRGAARILSWRVLLSFFGVYSVLLAGTSLLFLPTGAFVPQMLLGASYGRLVGLLQIAWDTSTCAGWFYLPALALDDADLATHAPACLKVCGSMSDPAKFAIVGAASFLGGSNRLALFMIVTLLEITDDLSLVTPIAIAVLASIFIGNLFNEGVYHVVIAAKGLPYLHDRVELKIERATVEQAMASPVQCIPARLNLTQLAKFLRGSMPHNGFPVVDSVETKKLLGFILRERLERLHAKIVISSGGTEKRTKAAVGKWKFDEGSRANAVYEVLRTGTAVDLMAKPLLDSVPSAGRLGVEEKGLDDLNDGFLDDDEEVDGDEDESRRRSVWEIPTIKGQRKGEIMDSDGNVVANSKAAAKTTLAPIVEEDGVQLATLDKIKHVYEDRTPIDLTEHMDLSPWTVKADYSLGRAFKMFRNLGLRHLTVTDAENRVVGMLTRKDLMPWAVRDQPKRDESADGGLRTP